MTIGEFIKRRRNELDLTLEEIGKATGVSKSTVKKWETGFISNMGREKIAKLAKILSVSPAVFIGDSIDDYEAAIAKNDKTSFDVYSIPGISPIPQMRRVPRLGTIACGKPITAEQNIDGYDLIEADIKCDFTLTCKGDSMINARIFDGDIVYIRQQPDVEDGEIAAVLIDNEATLKKVYHYPDRLVLRPCNPMYEDFVYSGKETADIRILGKAVMFKSFVR